MNQEIGDWEIISKKVPKSTFWEAILHLFDAVFFLGLRAEHPVKFTLCQKSTGYIKTIMAYDESELPDRIAKRLFDHETVISEDAGEIILTGIRSGGDARALAFDNIEYVFRHRLQKGDIDPQELFANLQDFLRPAGEEAVQEFTRRCFPVLSPTNQLEKSPGHPPSTV